MRLRKDLKIVREYKICDWCLRRLVNRPSDEALKEAESFRNTCSLCHSIPFKNEFIEDALVTCAPYSFRTYSVSIRMDSRTLKMEEEITVKYRITKYIPIKKALRNYFKRELSKRIDGKLVDIRPEINLVFDFTGPFRVRIYERSYIIGLRYIKLNPDARVNASACPECNGRGCPACLHTGKADDGSFESFLIYNLPRLINSTVPRITWALRDIYGSTVAGNGYPVYLSFRSIYDRVMAPLMIPESPVPGIRIILSQSLDRSEDIVRNFKIKVKIVLDLKSPLSSDDIYKRVGKGELTITGIEGKVWKKNIRILKASVVDNHAELIVETDSGVNIYSWLGEKTPPDSKQVEPKLFSNGEAVLKRIDVLNVEGKCIKAH